MIFQKKNLFILTLAMVFFLCSCGSSPTEIGDAATEEYTNAGYLLIGNEDVPLGDLPDESTYRTETEKIAVEVFHLCNEIRKENNLTEFVWSDALYEVTSLRAGELLQSFSHVRPDGTRWTTALEAAGIGWSATGENVGMGYKSAQAVVDGWMNSDGHRANILSANTQLAVGAAKLPEGGTYKGYAFAMIVRTP